MALTKAELAEALFAEIGLNKREAKDLVDEFFGVMRAALEAGEEVKLSGFGKFGLRDQRERPGRNPRTGEPVQVRPRRVVQFKPSGKLKERVDAQLADEPRKYGSGG
ncbi:MAG TPA: integration host factor subunit alpha [Gammaproteobacteria bacterium]|nr:integration host factor subunit alpha [Gammaproteobacteria bacterium]